MINLASSIWILWLINKLSEENFNGELVQIRNIRTRLGSMEGDLNVNDPESERVHERSKGQKLNGLFDYF